MKTNTSSDRIVSHRGCQFNLLLQAYTILEFQNLILKSFKRHARENLTRFDLKRDITKIPRITVRISKNFNLGTSINYVPRFSAVFDLPNLSYFITSDIRVGRRVQDSSQNGTLQSRTRQVSRSKMAKKCGTLLMDVPLECFLSHSALHLPIYPNT